MKNGTIIYIGGFRFPNGNAAAKLALNYANIFSQLDYRVVLVGIDENSDTDGDERLKSKIFDYDVWNLKYDRSFRNRLCRFVSTENVVGILSEYDDVSAVICYNFRSVPLLRLSTYCRKNGIKVISNTTEWYGKFGQNVILGILNSIDTALRMYVANRCVDGLIVTSSFLKDFYKGSEVVVVPSLSEPFDRVKANDLMNVREKVHLVYAGTPFSVGRRIRDRGMIKDRLDKTIGYLFNLFEESYDFQFDIYGITREQYVKALPEDEPLVDALKEKVCFHGFMDSDVIYSAIENADFTILVRDVSRVTLAGFPTKIAESINLGTPVLTTRIGDMERYVVEGQTGFFFMPNNDDYNISVLRKVLSMDYRGIDSMKRHCRESTVFRRESWINPIADFLDRL